MKKNNRKNAHYSFIYKQLSVTILNDCYGSPKKVEIHFESDIPLPFKFAPYINTQILQYSEANKFRILYYKETRTLYITLQRKAPTETLDRLLEKIA